MCCYYSFIVIDVFLSVFFAKMLLPLWYAYASFLVLLFSTLLSYFVNYKQVLLSADQKEYRIQYSYKAVLLIKILIYPFIENSNMTLKDVNINSFI